METPFDARRESGTPSGGRAAAPAPHAAAFRVEDLERHRSVTETAVSPDGSQVVFSVRSVDRGADGYRSQLWLGAVQGAPARALTSGTARDMTPVWSPDGHAIAFVSDRAGGSAQPHVIDLRGGEARAIGSLAQGASMLRWTPDARALLVTSAMSVDPDLRGQRSSSPPPDRGPNAPEVAWRLPYKADGIGYLLQREIHLFHVDVASGEARQLTQGPFDVRAFAVSPNGRHVAYVRTAPGRFAHRAELWVCDLDGERQRKLVDELATVMYPAWSPDGRWIVVAGAREEGDAQASVWLVDFTSGTLQDLGGPEIEIAGPESLFWDGEDHVVFVRAHRGRHQLAWLSVPDGTVATTPLGDRQLSAFSFAAGTACFAVGHPALPSDVWTQERDAPAPRRITDLNPWWTEREPVDVELRTFDVPDGSGGRETVEGWLVRPRDRDDPLPLAVVVHGGPASYALLDVASTVFWRALCARGWGVLAVNAVGSASYGREFCTRLAGHWGERDLPQHLAALESLVAEGVGDGRGAIAGKSYGGYLAAWAIGHTDRFGAAVVMAPVGNIETHYGTSDGGYYADPLYMGTPPRFDRELARALSPLQHVEKARTPTLFLQGKDDERCPKCQSEELFVSLLRTGDTPAELVLYPAENHHFLEDGRPSSRADAARRIVEWIVRFGSKTAPTDRSRTS